MYFQGLQFNLLIITVATRKTTFTLQICMWSSPKLNHTLTHSLNSVRYCCFHHHLQHSLSKINLFQFSRHFDCPFAVDLNLNDTQFAGKPFSCSETQSPTPLANFQTIFVVCFTHRLVCVAELELIVACCLMFDVSFQIPELLLLLMLLLMFMVIREWWWSCWWVGVKIQQT